jgi:hypothetical protein
MMVIGKPASVLAAVFIGLSFISRAYAAKSAVVERYKVASASIYTKHILSPEIKCAQVKKGRHQTVIAGRQVPGDLFERLYSRKLNALNLKLRKLTGKRRARIEASIATLKKERTRIEAVCAEGPDEPVSNITSRSSAVSSLSSNFSLDSAVSSAASKSSASSQDEDSDANLCNLDNICSGTETGSSCPQDCGCNTNSLCETARGENAANCAADCYNLDSDHDGLPDGWELNQFGNLSQSALDDKTFSWQSNTAHYLAGTDPHIVTDNLLPNPSFEEGSGGQSSLPGWEDWGHGGTKTIDLTEFNNAQGGRRSWKWARRSSDAETSVRSGFIQVDPSKRYMLVAYAKSLTGNEKLTMYWRQYSAANEESYRTESYYVVSQREIPRKWTPIVLAQTPYWTSPNTQFIRVTLKFESSSSEERSIWLDDLALYEMPDDHFQAFPCENTADARCLHFGRTTPDNISFNADVLGAVQYPGEDAYRSLQGLQTLNVDFDAFNVDDRGLPRSAMLLEIKYRDSINDWVHGSQYRTSHRAMVSSRIDYLKDMTQDPDLQFTSNLRMYPLTGLGRNGNWSWKYAQYGLQKSNFQLLHAVDGKFRISVAMPNCESPVSPSDAGLVLPIQYISLRAITDEDYASLADHQRLYRGFYEVPLPLDQPEPAISYGDPELVVFTRDLMRPILPDTKPAAAELGSAISALAARDDMATLNFGLYSEEGIENLNFQAADLSGPGVIPAGNIKVSKVVYKQRALREYGFRPYAIVPDYLDEASPLSIPQGTSLRIWIKIKVPAGAAAGVYHGSITISKGGEVLKTVQLSLEVLPLTLDPSPHANVNYGYPYYPTFSEDIEELFRLYREAGLEPYALPVTSRYYRYGLQEDIHPIYDQAGKLIDFDLSVFESHLDRMLAAGAITRQIILEPAMESYVYFWATRQSLGDTGVDTLWNQLNDSVFTDDYGLLIRRLIASGQARGIDILFEYGDEPGVNLKRRVMSDRIYRLIQANGGKTTVTYFLSCDESLLNPNLEYGAPASIEPLTQLINYKVWATPQIDDGYQQTITNPPPAGYYYGYYTTESSFLPFPINNRFLHGLLALRTDAKVVSAYAMANWQGDPYNDMDPGPNYRDDNIYSFFYFDFLFAYPSWDGRLLENMAYEGIRLGIRDARLAATIYRLTDSNHAHPARQYIENLKSRISPDYKHDYLEQAGDQGFDGEIIRRVSEHNDPADYEAYSAVSDTMLLYLKQLAG